MARVESDMSDKQKWLLFRIFVSAAGFVIIVMLAIVSRIEYLSVHNPQQDLSSYEYAVVALIGVGLFFALCFYVLAGRIDMSKLKTKPDKYLLPQGSDYECFKTQLVEATHEKGFGNFTELSASFDGEVQLCSKESLGKVIVIELVRADELTEEILEECTEAFWEHTTAQYSKSNDIMLIQCICVNRITKTFTNFVESNVLQKFGRYQLPVGVSFGGNTVYIAEQKEGFFKGRYKQLKRLFMGMMEGFLTPM